MALTAVFCFTFMACENQPQPTPGPNPEPEPEPEPEQMSYPELLYSCFNQDEETATQILEKAGYVYVDTLGTEFVKCFVTSTDTIRLRIDDAMVTRASNHHRYAQPTNDLVAKCVEWTNFSVEENFEFIPAGEGRVTSELWYIDYTNEQHEFTSIDEFLQAIQEKKAEDFTFLDVNIYKVDGNVAHCSSLHFYPRYKDEELKYYQLQRKFETQIVN